LSDLHQFISSGIWSSFFFYQGFFLLLNGSGSKDSEKAVISVPVLNPWSQSCVEFWYYMLGPSVSTLDLLVQTVCARVKTTTNFLLNILTAVFYLRDIIVLFVLEIF